MMETGLAYLRAAVASVVLAGYIRVLGYSARAHHFAVFIRRAYTVGFE